MDIQVRFLENLRLEARFDDFKIITDQPIRYKGDGSAPSPFDYFLASSALCAAYFVKVYCKARGIPTEDIKISQNNIVDPEDRYNQIFQIKAELPESISEKHRKGILQSIERCTVKKVIQTGPEFDIKPVATLGKEKDAALWKMADQATQTHIVGKDLPLEQTIAQMTEILAGLGIKIEAASWRNLVPNVWSVHLRDADSPMCFTNGKGASKESALCSALGEYIERVSCNYFYNDHFLGLDIAKEEFVHYPDEKWFPIEDKDTLPLGLLDERTLDFYNPEGELTPAHLADTNSGSTARGVCALPFKRQSDGQTVYFPVNLIGNLYASNGMSAGNTQAEAQVQCLSEIFERAVKKTIIEEEIALPDVPEKIITRYPDILAGIRELENKGFPIVVKDASLGGRFPVMCVTLMNPKTGGVYASFGAHPKFEVALERSLTELLQGRSFEGLNDVQLPTFSKEAVQEPTNFVEHFIDSTGVISWKFFSAKHDYEFCDWDFAGNTEQEKEHLLGILRQMEKEVYIAQYAEFGSQACRILVPGYSEIYPVEDLIWDNTNKALLFREDILNLHRLSEEGLQALLERLDEYEVDAYTMIPELIGIEFDENTVWGQLNAGELRCLIHLALNAWADALDCVQDFLNFNDNTTDRRLFFQALQAGLQIELDSELEMADYTKSLTKMFGKERMDAVLGSLSGSVRFYGLQETNMQLDGLEKHLNLIASYKKLHSARKEKIYK